MRHTQCIFWRMGGSRSVEYRLLFIFGRLCTAFSISTSTLRWYILCFTATLKQTKTSSRQYSIVLIYLALYLLWRESCFVTFMSTYQISHRSCMIVWKPMRWYSDSVHNPRAPLDLFSFLICCPISNHVMTPLGVLWLCFKFIYKYSSLFWLTT